MNYNYCLGLNTNRKATLSSSASSLLNQFLYLCCAVLLLLPVNQLRAQSGGNDILARPYTPPSKQGTILFYIQDIQKSTGVSVSYSSSFLHLNKKVQLAGTERTTGAVLTTILQGTGIQAAALNGKIFLLRESSQTQYYTISGFVKETNSNEAIIGASVYDPVTKKGTETNSYGFYSLQVPDSCQGVVFSHISYKPIFQPLPPPDEGQLDIHLETRGMLQTVVVNGEKEEVNSQPGFINMPVGYVSNFPALLGEKDVLKSLQLYPGASSSLESSSNLLIRGGAADQNLYLLDGVPLYHTGHLFGLFSIFNGDAVKDVSLYKDAFPARYGGRLSSVVDIRTKDGNMKEWHGSVTASPVSASALLEGPIVKDKSAVLLSVRRSLVDALYGQTYLKDYGRYYLYDVNFKLNQVINNKNRVYVSFYKGQDKMFIQSTNPVIQLFDDYNFDWSNITAAVKWTRVVNPRVFSNTTATYSRFYNLFTQNSIIPLTINDSLFVKGKGVSRIRDIAVRNETEYNVSNRQHISLGGGYTYHNFAPTAYHTNISAGEAAVRKAPIYYMSEVTAYAEDELSLFNDKLIVRPGLHFGALIQSSSFYASAQPRIMVRWQLPQSQFVQVSFAKMTQFVHQLTTPVINLPTDLWVPSTDNIKPEHAFSYSLSYQRQWSPDWRFNVNFYYKQLKDIVTTNTVLNIFDNSDLWEKKVIAGNGYNYGSEILLEKTQGKLTGVFSYTLSWAWRQFDRLNGGKMFPYKEDRRHNLSLALKYRINEKWNLSASWKFASGAPFTLPTQIFPDFDWARNIQGYLDERYSPFSTFQVNYLPYIARLNNYRLNAVHHLDLGANLFLGSKRRFKHVISGGIYNIYNRSNPFIVSFDQFSYFAYDNVYPLQLYQYSLFRTLPYLSYTFKF
ncbi:TonB-dependent receptor [Chitinophaga polysaccharea]|uniref:TonB-dependent receptor n=1 Tax=Chitinophaga TaxID=79328 RepID=UPI001455ACB7|nr:MULTISPECIES: carboxypeptidase-like regulatory domain-containing protein [Chitinophaga]NLR57940.1 TonB-dependent receptor [Chitinophaga polysaccharea]NLU93533.1 TonB-dependent receptor [Chitinophaga sp. Ak27]